MIRVLLLADTHLGQYDDSFSTFAEALTPARRGEIDLVVHGGDVFFRSRVKPDAVVRAFAPLKRIADSGIPVVVVPGNHERSAIPYPLLAMHPNVHIFDRARVFHLHIHGLPVAIAGFPCVRNGIERELPTLLEQTGWSAAEASIRLLTFHQTVEGATVGPVDFVFWRHADVIPATSIPGGFAAVLAGHIHRHQVLRRDLRGRPMATPVFYPGSIERVSAAERDETKGYVTLAIAPDANGGFVESWRFHELS